MAKRMQNDGLDDPPIPADIEKVEREYGRLPSNADRAGQAERWRLVEATKLIRLYDQGRLPLEMMHELDKLRGKR